ncbi:MAG: SDR family NAD(P)-dependent oxidoreductase [Phycisphaerae bacterium]|jgi:NAD(P)-dependent dehydrogenase (short-subunit alcohol dehydrogenase family)
MPKCTLPLENKVALITGAAGAIGYGICEVFLENGCTVVATDLPGEKLDNFAKDLNQLAPGKSIGIPKEVTSVDSVAKAIDRVYEKYGRLDIVVHNAGIAHVSKIVDMDIAKFQLLEKVNVDGTLIVLAQAGRRMIKHGKGGDIVIMSTKNVPSPSAGFSAYSATKAACHQLGRIASLEFAEYDIRVNMVAPDAVFSEGKYKSGLWELVGNDRMKARGISEKELHDYYRNRNLLKAAVTGRHVANAVLYFVTRQSPTTGATIPVDGGLPDATPR